MKARTAYLVQVIEKIGGPLLDAVTANSAKDEGVTISKEQAEQLATLLAKTVQLSISLGKMIEIEKSEPEVSDSLRVAMAGLASPIVASQYRHSAKIPSDDDMNKLGNALEAVMTFSDNFSPSPENAERLKNIQAHGAPGDVHQINIQYIQAFVPVADVITRFPFGQAEKKMVQDASEKITAKAKTIRQDIFGDIEDQDTQRLYELGIVKALADLYTHCHTQEMEKLLAMQEPDADAQKKALTTLWDNFNIRAETLQTLAENIMPKGVKAATSSSGGGAQPSPLPQTPPSEPQQAAPATPPTTPPVTQQPPAAPPPQTPPAEENKQQASAPPPVFQKPQSAETPAAAPPQQQTPAAATPPPQEGQQQNQDGNPMSMFANPNADESAAPSSPPPQAAPATPPPAQQPENPAEPPPEQPPESGEQSDSSGGGPMSFFKTPPKDEG